MTFGLARATAVVLLGATTVAVAQTPDAQTVATRMQRKLVAIVDFGERPANARRPPQRTSITDAETNAFFAVNGPLFLPEGVSNAQLAIGAGGRVTARAIVDLDKTLRPKERSWLDPLAYLTGKVEVAATGTLKAAGGKGQFSLERTTIGGVSVPNTIMQELVTYYSKSDELPGGIRLEEPFDLPSRIQSVTTALGLATIVQ
jgi:hypothetical protein